jgi:hypothetical protein
VARILQALRKIGPFRVDGSSGPMRKSYDARLFDVRDVEGLGEAASWTELELLGFNVRALGADDDDQLVDPESQSVDEKLFCKWMELAQMPLGSAFAKWWLDLAVNEAGGEDAFKVMEDDSAGDLFPRIACATVCELAQFMLKRLPNLEQDVCLEECQDRLLLELSIVAEHFPQSMSSGTMDKSGGGADPDADATKVAEQALFGWPAVSDKPVWSRSERRFVDCYPLEFPMGVADMYEDRARPVKQWEYTQHMLRLASGQMINGLRGHRVTWSLVNSALLNEAQGKCFAVHRCMLRRLGARVVGGGHLSKAQLKAMMEDKSESSEMLRQLLTVGKDIRSTPMSWSYEAKKLDAAVKHLSWRQLYVGLCL